MKYIKADTAKIRSARLQAAEITEKILGKVSRLREMAGSLHNMWEGEAGREFAAGFLREVENLRSACECIRSLMDTQETAAEGYEACEDQIAEELQALY